MGDDLLQAGHDNFRMTWETIVSHFPRGQIRQFGTISGVSAGVASPMYNRIFVFESPDRDDLAAAVAWLSGHDVPFGVFVADDAIRDVEECAEDIGIESMDVSFPGMLMSSLEDVPPSKVTADIAAVADDTDLDDFRTVLSTIPEFPTDAELVMPTSIREVDMITLFIGRINGQPAACGWLARAGDVAGVYGIGVDEPFRRQGLGEAMTREVLWAGRDAGCDVAVLQSTPLAVPLYEKMGFETVTDYHLFTLAR